MTARPPGVAAAPPAPAAAPPTPAGPDGPVAPPAPPADVHVPPRHRRFRPLVWHRLDWAAAVLCALIIYGALVGVQPFYTAPIALWHDRYVLPLILAVVLSFPVAIRRRRPSRALVLVLAGCTVALALGGAITRGPFLPLALVLFLVAATARRAVALLGLGASLALLIVQGVILHFTATGPGNAITVALVLIIVWVIGYTVQQRRAYATRLREQVASAAVTEERLRIARELHDVVAHSMTVVAVQAGFGEYVFETEPGEAKAALGAIQRVTREALTDMQRMLGVLRQDAAVQSGAANATAPDGTGPDGTGPGQDAAPGAAPRLQLTPAPGLGDLDRLVSTTAVAGVRVDVATAGDLAGVPASVGQSAFRIVQESLTNVVKHSGADCCQVIVARRGGGLDVEITDRGQVRPGAGRVGMPGPGGAGHGIIGMRERVSLCGGEFSAGPLPGRGFRVSARFPLNGAAR